MSELPRPGWLDDGVAPRRFALTLCANPASASALAQIQALVARIEDRQPLSETAWRCITEANPAKAWQGWNSLIAGLDDIDVWFEPLRQSPYRLLICDMDMTIVAAETLDEVAASLGLGDAIAAITRRAMHGELDFDAALRERIGMLAGQDERAFVDLVPRLELHPGAEALIAAARRNGVHTILVSGGFSQVAEPVAERLGFDEVHCNHLVLEDGRLTGEVQNPIVNARLKRSLLIGRAAEMGIDLEDCCAIGDGANDRLMIEAAGLGIAYHGKPVLRAATACRIDHTDLATAAHFMGLT